MKTTIALLFALSLTGVATTALAEEAVMAPNTSSVKTSDVQKKDEQFKDIDQEITNAKLRAESGSKSKWSVKTDITVNGGSLNKPFDAKRPNYAGAAGTDRSTSIAGTIAGAYRLTEKDSLRLGTGIFMATPFQSAPEDISNSRGAHKTDVSNPYLEYSRSFRVGQVQNIFDMSYTKYTQVGYVEGYQMVGSADVNHTFMLDMKGSNWSPGINIDANTTTYKDGALASDTRFNAEDGRSDYELAAYPLVEYAFNDRYSFRTVFRFLTYDHYRSDAGASFLRQVYTQSVGLGIAVTRDIYLYPNVQFAPEKIARDKYDSDATNVGLSTTINVF